MAQLTVPLDAQRFGKGLPWKDYMAQMGDTRARTEDNYAKSNLTDDERAFFSGSALGKVKYALMLAENWCGDVHRNSPLLAHICEAMPNCELRVFFRDQNLDITDLYLNNGYRSIPVIVFFDANWNEIGRWIERSGAATQKVDAATTQLPGTRPREQETQTARLDEALYFVQQFRQALDFVNDDDSVLRAKLLSCVLDSGLTPNRLRCPGDRRYARP